MEKIALSKKARKYKGLFALVDDEDFEELNQYNWCVRYEAVTDSYYAIRNSPRVNGKQKTIYMHRVIMSAPVHLTVDHRNHQTLDNQRANLRLATRQNQTCNQRPRKGNSSQYKGVCLCKVSGKWRATIVVNRKQRGLGCYKTEKDAARAYDKAARDSHGEFAVLNF